MGDYRAIGFTLVAAVLVGCGGGLDNNSDGNPPGVFSLKGKVTGSSVPLQGKVFAIWHVLSAQPDSMSSTGYDLNWSYDYKFGEGTSDQFDFSSAFAAAPPADAISPYGFGTATLVLRDTTDLIADGKLDSQIYDASGDSASYRVVYRADGFTQVDPSMAGFQPGFSCGVCKADSTGFSATFQPVDCGQLSLDTPAFNGDCWSLPY
jgi:hypothetical protein